MHLRLPGLQRHGRKRLLDPRGQLADRFGRRLLPLRQRHGLDGKWLAKVQQRRAPECALRAVVQSGRDDHERRSTSPTSPSPFPSERRGGAHGDPRGAGLQRSELGVRVGRAFREDSDRAAPSEYGPRRLERLAVL